MIHFRFALLAVVLFDILDKSKRQHPGLMSVKDQRGGALNKTQRFCCNQECRARPAGLTILAEEAINVAEISSEMIAQRIKDAGEDLGDVDATQETREAAQTTLARMKELQAAL